LLKLSFAGVYIKQLVVSAILLLCLLKGQAKEGRLVKALPGAYSHIYVDPYNEKDPSQIIHAVFDDRKFDILEVDEHFLKISYYDPVDKKTFIGYIEKEVVSESDITKSMGTMTTTPSTADYNNLLEFQEDLKAVASPPHNATIKLGREAYIFDDPVTEPNLVSALLFGDRKFRVVADAGKYVQVEHRTDNGRFIRGYVLKNEVSESFVTKELPRAPIYIEKKLTLLDVYPGHSSPEVSTGVVFELEPRKDRVSLPYKTRGGQELNLNLNRRNYFLYVEKVDGDKVTATITDELGTPIGFSSGDNTVGVIMSRKDLSGFPIEKRVSLNEVVELANKTFTEAKNITSSGEGMCGFTKRKEGFTKTYEEIKCTLQDAGVYDKVGERNLQFLEATLHQKISDYNMDNKALRAHFYAQVLHETGGLSSLIEKANFGCYRDAMEEDPYSDQACLEYKSCADNDEDYFDNKYSASKNRYKARFRGRGILQTTHCAGYLNFLAHYHAKKKKLEGSSNPHLDDILKKHDQIFKPIPNSFCSESETRDIINNFKNRYKLDIDPDGLMSVNNGRENFNTIATPCENAKVGEMTSKDFLVGTSVFYWSTKCIPKYKREITGKKVPVNSNSAIDAMTKCVNGGLTHFKERRKLFRSAEKCMQ
jgi:predicted chitinase